MKQFRSGAIPEFDDAFPVQSDRSRISRALNRGGVKLDASQVPKRLHYLDRLPVPAAFITLNRMLIVNKTVRNTVVSLDGDAHAFFSIEILKGKGKDKGTVVGDQPYYVLNIWQFQDTIIDELSEVEFGGVSSKDRNTMKFKSTFGGPIKLVVDEERLGNLNIWREERYNRILMSDEMHTAFKAAKVKFFDTWQAEVLVK